MCACVGVWEGTCLWAHGSQSWTNGYFQDAWFVTWGAEIQSREGLKTAWAETTRKPAALDSFKWPHQINSTYQNKREQEPLSKPWHCLHCLCHASCSVCLLFGLTVCCSVWLPAVQSDFPLFSLSACYSVWLPAVQSACCSVWLPAVFPQTVAKLSFSFKEIKNQNSLLC